ncbi:DNA helicase-2/ATP-dependent DNA helicase PcrA [Paenibacillus shirakamiensis]|uniref:DNA 3'-5' helicase n=1 Tax=Paenibacillus shirakamiensis TaxID=1265935 RepID=A0ABS4JBD9_9BACL|nr:UvrD-helicase domain-containing protein [Paenibacillus shirakamiensis]MBP1999018.1 DNA helicase-2/ATP-dependent DNA helicase PcrA [Paenibacillus shirakamiensis]
MDHVQSAYQEEKERLDRTLLTIDEQLDKLRNTPVYTGHDYTEQVLEAGRDQQRHQLAKSTQEPYFGRLDFEEKGGERVPLYIGKVGVGSDSPQPLVIDWRAPVASLFYSFTGGDSASYDAPEGLIEGLVYLKRNVVIRQQILERVSDTFNAEADGPAVSDEFLVYRLGENKDNRLRDIVSTIQAEQDQIIRAAKNTALIIQGVAGSGKTTVALHRLAFLLYQYKEQITAEKMVIFAPNRMFIDYISDVLPELGVGDIQQSTFSDWAARILELEHIPQDGPETYVHWFDQGKDISRLDEDLPGRFKGSLAYRDMIEQFAEGLESSCLPDGDFSPWDGAVLPERMIREWYMQEYKPYPIVMRKERVLARIHRWIEMELKKAPSAAALKERKTKASQREKAYAKKWPDLSALTLFKTMMGVKKQNGVDSSEALEHMPPAILKETQAYLKKNQLREEDLPALLYLYTLTNELDGNERFDHVVIDEAQDFSPFQVAVLDRFVKNHSFTILGDLSQGIHYYKGVRTWDEMQILFKPEETAMFALTRSYRSTMEIINFANEILSRGVDTDFLAIPVFRSAEPVRLIHFVEEGCERQAQILKALELVQQGPYRTVAVLTRTLQAAEELHAYLKHKGLDPNLIDGRTSEYAGGLSVLPVYLSKGLEFDAVIIPDVNAEEYSSYDAKLLYVGCTRALHELWLLYGDSLPMYVPIDDPEVAVQGWPTPMESKESN